MARYARLLLTYLLFILHSLPFLWEEDIGECVYYVKYIPFSDCLQPLLCNRSRGIKGIILRA